jgi:transcriptional regulator with PAS, ATPase and Fis domain
MLLDEIVTRSASYSEILNIVRRVSQTDASVLLSGETGSGKDFVAELIHDASSRRANSFLKIDCASIPTSLAESELFGYEKGAFSDAYQAKAGKFELADHGTLYLDGVNHLPASIQSKLLRFVQERVVERLGGSQPVRVDCRLIASCSIPLNIAVKEGHLREDLYYRLAGVTIEVPALRDRIQDVELLASLAVKEFNEKYKKTTQLNSKALEFLRSYHWPGNVRELRNIIEHAVIHSNGEIGSSELTLRQTVGQGDYLAFAAEQALSLEDVEKMYIAEVLRKTRGHNGNAAKILKINRKTLLMKRRKYGLD